MIELFLQELLEDWRQGWLTQEEVLDGWTADGFTLPQMTWLYNPSPPLDKMVSKH